MKSQAPRHLAILAAIVSLTILHAAMSRVADAESTPAQKVGNAWERSETFRPPITEGGALSIFNHNGNLIVTPSDDKILTVVVNKKVTPRRQSWFGKLGKKAHHSDAVNALNLLSIRLSGDAAHPTLRTDKLPKSSGFNAAVTYTVRLPKGASASLSTTNGSIHASGTDSYVEADTSNGGIEIDQIDGKVSAHTTNGKIEIRNVRGPVSAQTTNGAIEARDLHEGLEAITTNGAISCHYTDVLPDNAVVRCQTTNGGITLRAAPDSTFSLKADAQNGKVRSSFPLSHTQTAKPDRLIGTVGTGGASVTLETTNGAIIVGHL